MTPMTLDLLLGGAATLIRLVAQYVKWGGGIKLSDELFATADKTDAFRTNPVFKQEIDSQLLGHVWGVVPPPTPEVITPPPGDNPTEG